MFNVTFYKEILNKNSEFENLSENCQNQNTTYRSENLNDDISYDQVSAAIDRTKFKKSYLEIPNTALKNKNAKIMFHKFLNFASSPV